MSSLHTLIAAGLVGLAAAQNSNVNSILTPATCTNLVANGNFEQDGQSGGRGYWYGVPTGWTSTNAAGTTWNGQWWSGSGTRTSSAVLVANGNGPWGGLNSRAGTHFAALQLRGTTLSQTISGLTVGQQYTLRFLAAERPGYGNAERLTVTLGGVALLSDVNPLGGFVAHQVTFTATATSGVLMFSNTGGTGDSTGFIDDISICAVPASCVAVNNGDFEMNPHGANYQYIIPAGWSRDRTNSVIALNGNGPWGGLNSGNGAYYVVLQGVGAQISQVITGLTQGTQYQVSFLAAERPGYGADERLTLLVNNAVPTGANNINVYGSFVQHQYTFTSSGTTANITFRNTAVSGGDQSVFVDEVTVCALPPPTTVPPITSTTTTTATVTTVTPQLARDLDGLRRNVASYIDSLTSRIVVNENTLRTYGTLSTTVSNVAAAQQQVITQVGGIANALQAAVAALPPASPSVSVPVSSPQILTTPAGNLLLTAPGRNVQIQGTCGVINPCDLLAALNALANV